MQLVPGTCSMDMNMQHGLGQAACTWSCSMDLNLDLLHLLIHVHAAWTWTCSMSKSMLHVQGKSEVFIMYSERIILILNSILCHNKQAGNSPEPGAQTSHPRPPCTPKKVPPQPPKQKHPCWVGQKSNTLYEERVWTEKSC
jgi:hypothetical protein